MADPAPTAPKIDPLPDSKKYYMRLCLQRYKRLSPTDPSNLEAKAFIYLPLPTELRDDTNVSYTNVNLETVGDAINGSAGLFNAAVSRNFGSLASMALSAGRRGLSNALEKTQAGLFGQVADLAGGAFIGMLQSILPPDQVTSALQQQAGIAPNPNPSVAFQGPVLRDFTMSWAFYPKNKTEADKVAELIRTLKSRSLPTWNSPDNNGTSILNYPYACQLNFYPWDSTANGNEGNQYGWTKNSIIRIKNCFMASVNANYNAFGTPAFFETDSYPTTIQLTISFKEIEYLTAEDWDAGYASEETKARGNYNSVTQAKELLGTVGTTAGSVISGFFKNFGGELADIQTAGTAEVQAAAAASTPRIDGLTPDGKNTVTYTSGTTSWTVRGDGEGKYAVDKIIGGGETPVTLSPKFNSRAELDNYLNGPDGPISAGVQPDAPPSS